MKREVQKDRIAKRDDQIARSNLRAKRAARDENVPAKREDFFPTIVWDNAIEFIIHNVNLFCIKLQDLNLYIFHCKMPYLSLFSIELYVLFLKLVRKIQLLTRTINISAQYIRGLSGKYRAYLYISTP